MGSKLNDIKENEKHLQAYLLCEAQQRSLMFTYSSFFSSNAMHWATRYFLFTAFTGGGVQTSILCISSTAHSLQYFGFALFPLPLLRGSGCNWDPFYILCLMLHYTWVPINGICKPGAFQYSSKSQNLCILSAQIPLAIFFSEWKSQYFQCSCDL